MSQAKLFQPISIGGLTLQNRIVIAPMCQYSAIDGQMTDWHEIHLGTLSQSGAGVLTIEATAVTPEGRISYGDVGLWDNATEAAMGKVLDSLRRWSDMPIAIQLGHAGRKASTAKPWDGGQQIPPDQPNGWLCEAPSPLSFAAGEAIPHALDLNDLARLRKAFADAGRRAATLGLSAIQLHAAHGYLAHQFLSPLSNQRSDTYGGSLENRMRFPLEMFDALVEGFGDAGPVTTRISGTDWVENGWDIEQSLIFAQALEARGCAAIHISSAGLDPRQDIPVGPNYQVSMARRIREVVKMPVIAVGLITEPQQAEAIIATGDADMIAIARGILYDPRWPWHAAAELGASIPVSPQFLRSQPRRFTNLLIPRR